MFGNLGEMAKVLSRVKDIQRGMKEYRDEMPRLEFSATSADGSVTATVSGDMVVKRIDFAQKATVPMASRCQRAMLLRVGVIAPKIDIYCDF